MTRIFITSQKTRIMIPRDYITEWRKEAPWIDDALVEQDLVISRALVSIFSHLALQDPGTPKGSNRSHPFFFTMNIDLTGTCFKLDNAV